MPWDVFLSHAFEDKAEVAEPLRRALERAGISVWIDESEMGLGDSMRRSMEKGLSMSRWGVVIISPAFLSKYWTQAELDALLGNETVDRKVVLPVLYRITPAEVRRSHPILASRKAILWSEGLPRVVAAIGAEVGSLPDAVVPSPAPSATVPTPGRKVVMVLSQAGKSFFVECVRMEISGVMELVLEPTEGQGSALAAALRETSERPVAVAFDLRAAAGRVNGVQERFEGGRHTVSLSLLVDDRAYGDSFMRDMAFNDLSADDLAALRARRILFNETLKAGTSTEDPFLDVLVAGMGVPLPVTSSPLPSLYKDFGGQTEAFLIAARLVLVLWLHLSGVVDQIVRLDLSMRDNETLAIRFEGKRPRRFVNAEPPMIRLEGVCNLKVAAMEQR